METNPRVVFERLFGDGSTPEERAARQRQFASLLDAVAGEVAPLQRSLPAADRERLDRYLTDIRELERRLALAADSTLGRSRRSRQAERRARRISRSTRR